MAKTRAEIAAETHWRVKGGTAACGAKSARVLTRKYREVDCARCQSSRAYLRTVERYQVEAAQAAEDRARELGAAADYAASMEYEE